MSIKQFDFYEELTQQQRGLLRTHLKPIEAEAGTTLFFQGDTTQDILLLLEGAVRVYIQGDGVDEITLYTVCPSEQCIVNTSSTLTQTPAIGSAVTMSPIKGYMLNRTIVAELMRQNDAYQRYIFSQFTVRLDSVARVLESVKFKLLDERIYDWLRSQKRATVTITHEQLAGVVGSTRVVISRTLKKMEREGLVKLGRGRIELVDV